MKTESIFRCELGKHEFKSVGNPHCYANLLLHIPHSSKSFPKGCQYSYQDLNKDEKRLLDYYTDDLFVPIQESENITSVVFPYCRLYCDVERLINDPLEKEGLGISYHRSPSGPSAPYDQRQFSSINDAFPLYADHHALMSKNIVRLGGQLLLIDCHSFSAFPCLLNPNPQDIDICIGYNDDETCPENEVIDFIVKYFQSLGYKVGINTPFSNSKTFSVPINYHSVMIEVNKRLYMNEQTFEKTDGFGGLRHDIQSLYEILKRPSHNPAFLTDKSIIDGYGEN